MLLSCWVQPTMSHPGALAQPTASNQEAAWGAGISPGPATASARGGQASKTTVRARCRSAHVCSACKPKPRFLQCQLTRRDSMRRAHLCPTRSWITGDNHEPPDAVAHLGLLFTIPLSVAHRGLQQVSNDLFVINSSKKHWYSN